MQVVEVTEAQKRLAELLDQLRPGEDILLSKQHQPVARLTLVEPTVPRQRHFGSAKGKILFHAGWEEPLEDFAPYRS
jgi:antitoxin (DNA-binding transcriptional repressor) of toxin-antitoxin stability system